MKVLQFQPKRVGVILSKAMRDMGIKSRVVATAPHPIGFEEDIPLPHRTGLTRVLRCLDWLQLSGFDVFHCHDTAIPRTVRLL